MGLAVSDTGFGDPEVPKPQHIASPNLWRGNGDFPYGSTCHRLSVSTFLNVLVYYYEIVGNRISTYIKNLGTARLVLNKFLTWNPAFLGMKGYLQDKCFINTDFIVSFYIIKCTLLVIHICTHIL